MAVAYKEPPESFPVAPAFQTLMMKLIKENGTKSGIHFVKTRSAYQNPPVITTPQTVRSELPFVTPQKWNPEPDIIARPDWKRCSADHFPGLPTRLHLDARPRVCKSLAVCLLHDFVFPCHRITTRSEC